MPLKNSSTDDAFSQNVKEMMKNHPQKVALAAAYAQKRKAEKRKKMWAGGEMEKEEETESDIEKDVARHKHDDTCDENCQLGEPVAYNAEVTDDETERYAKGGKVPFSSALKMRRSR